MGYMHIENLYRPAAQKILLFRECYALEKIHGTSAHIAWTNGHLIFSAGGEKHDNFVKLFNTEKLEAHFKELGHEKVFVYGEAYGGKQQAQSWRYGKTLKFVAFDVKIGDLWLDVPDAASVCAKLGLDFVHFRRISTDLVVLDAERDAPSAQAIINNVGFDLPREGVVLRPLHEFTTNNGSRVMAKHKRQEERETASPREIVDPAKLAVLEGAEAIAKEWVTATRLQHVLDKIPLAENYTRHEMSDTPKVITAMLEDVLREGFGEFVDTPDARKAISKETAKIFKQHVTRM